MTADRSEAGTAVPDDDRPDLASAFGDSAAGSLRGLLAPRRAPVRVVHEPEDGAEPGELSGPEAIDGSPEAGGPRVFDGRGTAGPSVPVTADDTPAPVRRPRTDPSTTRPRRTVAASGRPSRTVAPPAPRPSRAAAPDTPGQDGSGPSSPSGTSGRSGPSRADGRPSISAQTVRKAPTGEATAPRRRPRSVRVRDRHSIDLMLLAVARDGVSGGRQFADLVRERSGGAVELSERSLYYELHRLRDRRLIADTGRGSDRRYVLTEIGERVLASRVREWQAFAGAMDRVLTPEG